MNSRFKAQAEKIEKNLIEKRKQKKEEKEKRNLEKKEILEKKIKGKEAFIKWRKSHEKVFKHEKDHRAGPGARRGAGRLQRLQQEGREIHHRPGLHRQGLRRSVRFGLSRPATGGEQQGILRRI